MTQSKFLNTIFDNSDLTCFAFDTFEVAIDVVDPDKRLSRPTPFFSINALTGRRSDANVEKHRTFLLEFDNIPLDEQFRLMQYSGYEYTAAVYSGGKSIHFFITLENPVSADEYASIAKRLHLAFPAADKTTKNPSRLARLPGVIRPDTGKEQILMQLYGRINNEHLLKRLPELSVESKEKSDHGQFISATLLYAQYNPEKAMQQLKIEGRNSFFFWLGQRLLETGLSKAERREYIESAYSRLENKEDFKLREALMAARV